MVLLQLRGGQRGKRGLEGMPDSPPHPWGLSLAVLMVGGLEKHQTETVLAWQSGLRV